MTELFKLRAITEADLALLGLQDLAYVKTVAGEGGRVAFAIHAADGTEMAVLDDRDVAFAAVRQNDMEPKSVH